MNFESSLQKGIKKFRSLSRKTFHNPDPDNVHDLRVVTRRLRTDFWLIPMAERTPVIRKARGDLRQLTQILGEQRKYDVALKDAIHYGRGSKTLKKRLKGARKDVVGILRAKTRKRYANHVKQAFRDTEPISPISFCPRIEKLRRGLDRAIQSLPESNAARHHLRIEVKKARYLLEAFNHEIPRLTELQDHLGRWHDLMFLSGLSGHPKNLVDAHKKEWRSVERSLKPTLGQTTRALSAVMARLRSSGTGVAVEN